MFFECLSKFVTLTIIFTYFVTYLFADENIQKLPFCNPHVKDGVPVSNDLVIVSTLDGWLTAFSTKDGAKVWDLQTQPLLSSNLQHVELTAGGKWVRLVPSLRGTLYSLSGDTIEPLPFDAEQLLSSSFKYSDDLVIAGARETLWLGVDANTGGVIYECGSGGCNSEQQTAGAGHDVIVLRRHSNTVRALDPRSGNEKWNFSVAEHNLALSRRECMGPSGGPPTPVHVGVALPEGVIAIRRPGETDIIWRQKLEAPVVSMWRLHGGSLQHIDVLWEATRSLTGGVQPDPAPPSLYIGVHDKQLYIQEGVLYAQKLETAVSARPLPWKLVQSRPSSPEVNTALQVQEPDPNTLSLITLYGNTGQTGSHGFFLYLQETCDQTVQVDEDFSIPDYLPNASEEDHHHIHIHVSPLWYWWKELLVFAISTVLLMNLMIWPMIYVPKANPVSPAPTQEYIVIDRPFQRPPSNSGEFTSRYENDFVPLRCLGRGGFGVVFEARNNIDHREYAIKRITLPKREDKRERVLREVRALAKLEHDNIVRYFNAWIEVPPPRWQQERDAMWMRELDGASLGMSNFTATSPPPPSYRKEESVKLNLNKTDEDILNPDFDKLSKRNRSHSCSDSFTVVFDEEASKHSNFTISSETPKKHSLNSSDTSRKPSLGSSGTRSQSNPGSKSPGSRSPGSRSPGLSKAGAVSPEEDSSIDKRLQRVKEHEEFTKTGSIHGKKKKKGHTRHWSLDICVREKAEDTKMYLYIQMQLCRRDSLHDWLRTKRTADARGNEVKSLFSQIVSAVEYVHLAGLIHRDLKPSNIFFAPDGRVKVGDFGLVTTMAENSRDGDQAPPIDAYGSSHTHQVGTHLYMSPEQLLGRPYSYKVDIYSLGVILFELLQPFGTDSERIHCLQNLRNNRYPSKFHEKYPQEAEVLKLMLSEDPTKRPTAMGVRARAPLFENTDSNFHFILPSISVNC